jgi:hypothetical protein
LEKYFVGCHDETTNYTNNYREEYHMALISLQELNSFTNTNLSADHDTTYLDNVIEVVSLRVEAWCLGTLFSPTTITEERQEAYVRGHGRDAGRLIIRCNNAPLISVGSISYRIGSTETSLTITEADLDLPQAEIRVAWYGPMYRLNDFWITITEYMAGYTTIPDDVKMGVSQLVVEAVEADDAANAGSRGVLSGYRIGNYSETYAVSATDASTGILGLGTTRSIRAKDYLRRYRRVGVAR